MDHDDVREHEHDPDVAADADLVVRTRSGDRGAFGELWRRHYRAGVTVARNMTSSVDADDLVQEAYTRIYHSIVTGGGPTGSFRAYLFTSIRNTAAAWGRARRETTYDELVDVEDPSAGAHQSDAALDRSLTHRAFRSLPTRWQEVLWYSEIERMKPAEIAPLLGMKPTAVAQLTFRAREGLREAWIQAHLRSVADGSDCQWTIERLGAYARRNLGRRDHAKAERHLAGCVRCSIVAGEAKEVSSRLALVLLPLAVGAAGTAGYLATVQGGGAPLVALAAMPSSVMQGSVGAGLTVGGGGTAAAGTAGTVAATAGTAGAAGALGGAGAVVTTSAGAVATATGGASVLAAIAPASGLAAASIVVGGIVAAAVTLPAALPAPEPVETSITDYGPASLPSVLDESVDDTGPGISENPGPDPADIPLLPELRIPPRGADASNAGGLGRDSSISRDDESPGDAGSGAGTDSDSDSEDTPPGTGSGTPSRGTGNGGDTGNDGDTGNGSPTNGTGNGNGGTPPGLARKLPTTPTPDTPATEIPDTAGSGSAP